jgi:hypothetical protein
MSLFRKPTEVPVAVAYRDGFDAPLKFEVVGELRDCVSVLDRNGRHIGDAGADSSVSPPASSIGRRSLSTISPPGG